MVGSGEERYKLGFCKAEEGKEGARVAREGQGLDN